MGSDLARLGRPALVLPPFRNLDAGPPDSLPSLAQLGCTSPSSLSSSVSPAAGPPPPSSSSPASWTAVNHPGRLESASARRDVDSSSPSPTPDRAPDVDPHHHDHHGHHPNHGHHHAHHASAHAHAHAHSLHAHHPPHPSPLRPLPSSLSRRAHPRLAPKGPIGSTRQDSAASESPSPTVSARRSPDASVPSHGGAPAPSPAVDSLVPSPVLAPSLGQSSDARAAIHALTHPHAPPDPPQYSQCPRPQEQSNHHPSSSHPSSSSTANGHSRRRPKPLPPPLPLSAHHGTTTHPPSTTSTTSTASTLSPAPPRPLARPRRRTRGLRPVDGRALSDETSPVAAEAAEAMAQMAPPLLPPRDSPFPVSPSSTTFRSPASPPIAFARPSSYPGASASPSVSAAVNGHARALANGDAARAHRSPARQTDHASPATSSTADDLPRCTVCNEVYQPSPSMDPQTLRETLTGIRVPGTQSLDDYNQTMESLVDIIRGHYRNPDPDSDLSQWWEQHQHDSDRPPAALARPAEAESQSEPFHPHKRRRLSDGSSRLDQERYYAFQPTSGDTVFVTRPIAAMFPGDVPRQPYVPPPENYQNMWYIPSETPRNKTKRKSRHRTGPNATRSESDAQRGEGAPKPDERESSVRRRSSGAAPLDRILHS